ncbi:MAG: MBL fold metallo-hydrolase [Verrucomicrobia bacterium]|nr:MBL fold metallo-hydrolase [Verrucomicrobiota bacterium]
MELQILGTAAAEGWPAPFCECRYCEAARRRGGPNIRMRSGALLDDDIKIDYGADTVAQMQRAGRSLAKVRTLLFTHQHSDHIIPPELELVVQPFTQTPATQPLAVYGNAQVLALLREQLQKSPRMAKALDLRTFTAMKPVTLPGGDTVLPLPADHAEGAFVLRISRGKGRARRTVFYGHDSGLYPGETLNALTRGPKLDVVLFDCTNGGNDLGNRGHMGVNGVVRMAKELRKRGTLSARARLVATHFSHNGGLLHEELVQRFLPHGIEVAFDGMTVAV